MAEKEAKSYADDHKKAGPLRSVKYEALPARCSQFGEGELEDDTVRIFVNTGMRGQAAQLEIMMEYSDSINHLKDEVRGGLRKVLGSEGDIPSVDEQRIQFSGKILGKYNDSVSLGESRLYRGAQLAFSKQSHTVSFCQTTELALPVQRKTVDRAAVRYVNKTLALAEAEKAAEAKAQEHFSTPGKGAEGGPGPKKVCVQLQFDNDFVRVWCAERSVRMVVSELEARASGMFEVKAAMEAKEGEEQEADAVDAEAECRCQCAVVDLEHRKDITLCDLRLEGQIPKLPTCANLIRLWLSGNALSGSIPDFSLACPQLQSLQLHDNRLSGQLPCFLVRLIGEGGDVSLHGNLGFTLPTEQELAEDGIPFWNASKTRVTAREGVLCGIEELDLSNCCLEAPLPSFAACTSLRHLWLRGNHLTSDELQRWEDQEEEQTIPPGCIVYS